MTIKPPRDCSCFLFPLEGATNPHLIGAFLTLGRDVEIMYYSSCSFNSEWEQNTGIFTWLLVPVLFSLPYIHPEMATLFLVLFCFIFICLSQFGTMQAASTFYQSR